MPRLAVAGPIGPTAPNSAQITAIFSMRFRPTAATVGLSRAQDRQGDARRRPRHETTAREGRTHHAEPMKRRGHYFCVFVRESRQLLPNRQPTTQDSCGLLILLASPRGFEPLYSP